MDRLTFLDNGKPAYKVGDCVYKNEIARRLYDYENTRLTPEEINVIKKQVKKMKKIVDETECIFPWEKR